MNTIVRYVLCVVVLLGIIAGLVYLTSLAPSVWSDFKFAWQTCNFETISGALTIVGWTIAMLLVCFVIPVIDIAVILCFVFLGLVFTFYRDLIRSLMNAIYEIAND